MSYHEFTISVSGLFKDRLVKRLTDLGCLGVIDQNEAIVAYFPEIAESATITSELSLMQALIEKSGSADGLTFTHRLIPEQDWNETWKKGFVPIDVGERFTILPPWEEKKTGRVNLIIDPGMAFGTGHHETTRSCLVLMEKYVAQSRKETFLDLGTGTGILAIAALKLGYQKVIAVDTDPLAVDASRTNIVQNDAGEIEIRESSIAGLEAQDFIAANLISGVLVLLAPEIASHLKPGGVAVLSGILAGQDDEVVEAMKQAGLKLVELYPDGKWISLAVRREV
jgi:ribosomal protein L11 methyltransferase